MKIRRLLPLLIMAVIMVTMMPSCDHIQSGKSESVQADSLLNIAYRQRDYNMLLELADEFQNSGEFSEIKASYWRGYAYSRLRKMRLAESHWKKATSLEIHNDEDMEFYSKSANRLAGLLLLKGNYEETMKLAVPAMKRMAKTGQDNTSDYAYLETTVGCCQLKLGNNRAAVPCFVKAYEIYRDLIESDSSKTNFTSAIVGVITITDNYLTVKRFQEAYDWTGHFADLLDRYTRLPDPDAKFIDKQQARLNFYRACALEGLGHKAEAAEVYAKAQQTNYAKTVDGQIEATSYLMSAHRWAEAARMFEVLDVEVNRYGMVWTLDVIQHSLLPKYRANVGANRLDSALEVGTKICHELDSAILRMQQDEAAELATIYNTQQKETELAQQREGFARQRFLAAVIALVLVILVSALIIYYRQQSATRLAGAYAKLEVANERIKESSRMKTSFIQQISHEIRTPLNILSGFTQVITTPGITLDDDTKSDISEKIIENTNRITELVNKMLELSDVSSKAVIERSDNVLAIQMAAQAMSNFPTSDKYKISIDLQVGEGADSVMLLTNEQAVTRILVLLLDNAERFTKEGTICLSVQKSDEWVMFIVEDTGIGVPKEEAEHIFEEFVQLNEYEEGTGIGLTVARSLSRRLGGNVVLDTSYTGGARFVLTLPLETAS